jgi:hypothetical protein
VKVAALQNEVEAQRVTIKQLEERLDQQQKKNERAVRQF